jgi:hypothetical protein
MDADYDYEFFSSQWYYLSSLGTKFLRSLFNKTWSKQNQQNTQNQIFLLLDPGRLIQMITLYFPRLRIVKVLIYAFKIHANS